MIQKSEGRKIVQDLAQRFASDRSAYLRPASNFNETQLRTDFLDRFLSAFGWDLTNEARAPQRLREVIVEELIDVEDEPAKKKPDYTLRRNGERLFFVEAKKPRVPIAAAREPAFQTRRYGWNAGMSVSVLTNFDKLALYDCTLRPKPTDGVNVGLIRLYDHTEYVEKFDEIYEQLSRESAHSGRFDALFGSAATRTGSEPFDRYFLGQIEGWRRQLAGTLAASNPALTNEELNFLVQRLINRIVFLRICEDRKQETYERLKGVRDYAQLKALFQAADRRYNSGLFDFLEDTLSFNVSVDSAILIDIFDQLYAPRSPYDFSVVEPGVLGEIYEQFLAKQVALVRGRDVEVVVKPEVAQSDGVVTTPKQVADRIVGETLAPLCEGKAPEALRSLRLADIACGSGVFLLCGYEYLLDYHLDWYVRHEPQRLADAAYQTPQGEWKLTLAEKHRILTGSIFGVDIDIQAVEITRFSLLLKVLEGEDTARIDAHLEASRSKALPNLNANVQSGNSLVDSAYYRFAQDSLASEDQLVAINPLDWKDAFPQVMQEGGFDAVVGNPPYIRIQNMVRYSPDEVAYLKSALSPYRTARQDNFDKYALFIERAISLLKPGGRLGYIVPHKFFTIRAGRELRSLLSAGQLVRHIVHFGVNQVFTGRSTYTCVLMLSRQENPTLTVEHVRDVAAWRQGRSGVSATVQAETLSGAPWVFVSPQLQSLFDRIKAAPRMGTLGGPDGVADVFVGIQTSADKIYIIRPDAVQEAPDGLTAFTDAQGRTHRIETAILRPCLLDAPLAAFGTPAANASVIFPYRIENGRATAYTPEEMQERFPLCLEYLRLHEEALRKRSVQKGAPELWYRFGRSQSLIEFDGRAKLVWPVLSLEPRYAYDAQDILFTGGGNGPYYALRAARADGPSLFYLLAVLSHPLIELMVRSGASTFRGGYVSHGKQFLAGLPIREINAQDPAERGLYETIVDRTQQLIRSVRQAADASTPQRREVYRRQSQALRRQIEEAVGALYGLTPDDLLLVAETAGEEGAEEPGPAQDAIDPIPSDSVLQEPR